MRRVDLDHLQKQEVDLLLRRYEGETLAQAAKRLGISRLAVRRIENSALRRISGK